MIDGYKKMIDITLRDHTKVRVPYNEGNTARSVKVNGKGGSIIFPSLKNRVIDTAFIMDIKEVAVQDDQTLLVQSTENQELEKQLKSENVFESEGYKKFQAMKLKFLNKKIR